jgi:hypothetical protein
MGEHYLLEVAEGASGHEFVTRHLIEAEDRQKVKYHYHRTLKTWAYREAPWGDKHALQRDALSAELFGIRKLTDAEYKFLDEFLVDWVKV